MTSCKCVGWGVVDCQLVAISPDTMQRSPPWPLHHWKSLLFLAYIKKIKIKKQQSSDLKKKQKKQPGDMNNAVV